MTISAARLFRSALVACVATLALPAVVPYPVAAQEGAAAAQDVTLTDVTLPMGGTVLKIPKLTASGTRLSRDDLASIFKTDSAEPWPARLAKLDAASLSAPLVTTDHDGPGEMRQSATYRDVVARNVHAGIIGELTAAGITLSAKGAKAAPASAGTYGALRATDVDLPAMTRVAIEPGDGKGPLLRLYGTLQLSDMAVSDDKGTTFKIAKIEARDVAARQVPNGWNGAFDLLATGVDDPVKKRAAGGMMADLLSAQSIGSVEIRGVSISDSSREPLLAEIERIAYGTAAAEGGIGVEGLTVASGPVRSRLGKLSLTGVSLAPLIAELRRMSANPDSSPGAEDVRKLAGAFGTLTLTDLTVDLPQDAPVQKRGAVDGVREKQAQKPQRARLAEARPPDAKAGDPLVAVPSPKPNRIALRQGVVGVTPVANGSPAGTRVSLTGLDVPASLAAGLPLVGALPAYGYGDLTFDLAADVAWDDSARTVTLKDVTVAGKDIGTIKLAALFGGIGPELFSGSAPAQTMLLFSGNARTLDLTVENSGLFERFLSAQAKELSLKPDELRKEYVTASVLGVPVILGNSPAAKGIGAAMGQFVMNPGKLTIHAKSKEPTGIGFVELGTAGSPASVLDKLDIDAKAN